MLIQYKVTEFFCIANDFCKVFVHEFKKHKMLSDDGKKHRNHSCDAEDTLLHLIDKFGQMTNFCNRR